MDTETSDSISKRRELRGVVGFGQISQGLKIGGREPIMFEEFVNEFEKHCLILVRIIEPRLEESQGCSSQGFDEASSFLCKAEAWVSVTLSHKCSDEACKLEGIAVICDGECRLRCGKLIELGDFGIEFSHSGPNFMRTELYESGL